MTEEMITVSTSNGEAKVHIVKPETASDKAVMIIQEWWGVNSHILDIANRYAKEGFTAVVPDLYRGKIAKNAEEASKMMNELALDDGIETINAALQSAKKETGISSFGITGYCMGGTFSLRAACLIEGFKACAAFYGDIPESEVLGKLSIPTLFISGNKDAWITPEKVNALEKFAKENNLPLEVLRYEADHAFFNDQRPEVYNEAAAKEAWSKVTTFFKKNL